MRTIKFRGKVKTTGMHFFAGLFIEGVWVYGEPHLYTKIPHIHISNNEKQPIDINTLGQFTGLTDKDGAEIYEGDIVELREPNGMPNICKVEMCEKGYWCVSFGIHERIILGFIDKNQITVIGNIHDKPELLKNND